MHYGQSPFALTEHAAEATGNFLFHTNVGALVVNGVVLGAAVGGVYLLARAGYRKVFNG